MFFEVIAGATNYYVSPDGDNTFPGTKEQPWRTIKKASLLAEAGDTVIIREGVYRITEAIKPSSSGTEDQWITYKAIKGEKVAIDAMDFIDVYKNASPPSYPASGAFHIQNVHHIRIQNLRVINARNVCFMIHGPKTHHIHLYNCVADRSFSSGIGVWYAKHIKIRHCEITRSNDRTLAVPGKKVGRETPHEALSIAGSEHFEAAYNHVHLCYKEGIDCKEYSKHGIIHHNHIHDLLRQGIYVDSWFGTLEDVEVTQNSVYNCEWGLVISAEGKDSKMKNIRVHHNLLYNNRGSGIFFGVWGHDEQRSHIYIYNNTIHNNGSPGHWAGPTGGIDIRSDNLRKVFIYNNICSYNYAFEIATFANPEEKNNPLKEKQIMIDHNLIAAYKNRYFEKGDYKPVYAYEGENCMLKKPRYINIHKKNFELTPSSPAIGTGMPDAPKGSYNYLGAFKPNKN